MVSWQTTEAEMRLFLLHIWTFEWAVNAPLIIIVIVVALVEAALPATRTSSRKDAEMWKRAYGLKEGNHTNLPKYRFKRWIVVNRVWTVQIISIRVLTCHSIEALDVTVSALRPLQHFSLFKDDCLFLSVTFFFLHPSFLSISLPLAQLHPQTLTAPTHNSTAHVLQAYWRLTITILLPSDTCRREMWSWLHW